MKSPFFSLAALALLAGAATPQADAPWSSQVVMTAPAKLGGCAVGDLDPAHPGNEIVAVCVTGEVFLSRPDRGRWVSEPIVKAKGELLQCAIGDADPTRPGNELLVVGMKAGTEDQAGAGMAYLVVRDETESEGKTRVTWKLEPLFEDGALIHSGLIGDVDPDHDGDEIAVAGFSKVVHIIVRGANGWNSSPICTLPGPAKSMVPFAGGLAVACADGTLIHLVKQDGAWKSTTLDKSERGYARLGAGGGRLIAARDDGQLLLITEGGEVTAIYGEPQKLRGAVLADLDPENPGLEAATAGYGLKLSVIYPVEGIAGSEWIPRVVHTDVDRFHHLAVGELDPKSPGLEIVGCGYSGRVIVAGKSAE
jgi:hypothetical protein